MIIRKRLVRKMVSDRDKCMGMSARSFIRERKKLKKFAKKGIVKEWIDSYNKFKHKNYLDEVASREKKFLGAFIGDPNDPKFKVSPVSVDIFKNMEFDYNTLYKAF